jgi:uncharacterized protein with PQ loop repeat
MDKNELVAWTAAALSLVYYISPIVPFFDVLKGKLYFEDSPGILVTCCYVNCLVWFIYGKLISNIQIKYSNLISGCFCIVFLTIYLCYEIRKYLLDTILNALILISGTWSIYRIFANIIEDDQVVGKFCFGTAMVLYIFPVYIIYRVIKEKNYFLIKIYASTAYLFACISWVIYGYLITDNYIIYPHAIGAVLYFILIIIYLSYKRKYPLIGKKNLSSTIGIEIGGNEEGRREESIKIDNLPKGKVKRVKIIK